MSAAPACYRHGYGRGGNADLATVYGFAAHSTGVDAFLCGEVAAAIAFLALRAVLPDRIYNFGEERTRQWPSGCAGCR